MGCKVWKGGSYIYKGERLHAIRAKKSGEKKKQNSAFLNIFVSARNAVIYKALCANPSSSIAYTYSPHSVFASNG
jgi:hypothetical protein